MSNITYSMCIYGRALCSTGCGFDMYYFYVDLSKKKLAIGNSRLSPVTQALSCLA